ncbi:MAG TPA: hypothetical protein VEG64_17950 [Candidatus Sulfotelmatobacter sp.]|nr:hypothetical protein [Candidatus Sulfotelmatobacter sp.]
METDRKFQRKGRALRFAGAVLAAGMAIAPAAMANGPSKPARSESVKVLAHLEIAGGPATRVQLVKQNKTQLLYIATSDSSRLVIVDVTKPRKAHIVEPAKLAAANLASAPAETSGDAPQVPSLLNASVSGATAGHEFSKSARFLEDEKRGLIYVVDAGGLWIERVQTAIDEDAMRIATYY